MKVDSGIVLEDLHQMPAMARKLESQGYNGCVTVETSHDPFLPLMLAAEHTERIELMTSIAVAFARTPMLLANIGHDLNQYSKGRFIMGLGSQIQPHITKRFSMPWSHPAARMREFIQAMRAIWGHWHEGTPLRFKGEYYTHSLMTPMFTPTNTEYGAPKVMLAAVGPMMTEVAGEVADGMIVHAFSTRKYIDEVTLPAIERGLATAGRARSDFQLTCPIFIVTGDDPKSWEANRTAVSKQLAFYGSTPAYRPVLELHGWGDLQGELNHLSKQGQWDEMGARITDEILDAFAVVGQPDEIAGMIQKRYGDVIDRMQGSFDAAHREASLATLQG